MSPNTLMQLMHAHQEEIFRYVKFLGADNATAEDVTQETFIGAYQAKKRPDLNNIALRAGWLRAIARNTFYKVCNRAKRNPVEFNSEYLESAEQYWIENWAFQDNGQSIFSALEQCLEFLPERQKNLINTFYWGQHSRQEVAQHFNMTEDGIKTALRRIRTALQQCIELRLKSPDN